MDYKKVLVSFSNSKVDDSVLLAALDIADKYGASLSLLHLNEKGAGAGGYYVQYGHHYDKKEVQALLDEKNTKKVKTDVIIIDGKPIVEAIVDTAKSYDLLVLGHHHMHFIEEMMRDSTDEKVINRVECHVLVVPEK